MGCPRACKLSVAPALRSSGVSCVACAGAARLSAGGRLVGWGYNSCMFMCAGTPLGALRTRTRYFDSGLGMLLAETEDFEVV